MRFVLGVIGSVIGGVSRFLSSVGNESTTIVSPVEDREGRDGRWEVSATTIVSSVDGRDGEQGVLLTTIVSSSEGQDGTEEQEGVSSTVIVLSTEIRVSADMPESRAEARVP